MKIPIDGMFKSIFIAYFRRISWAKAKQDLHFLWKQFGPAYKFLATGEQMFSYCYVLMSSEMVSEMGTTSINSKANRDKWI